MLDSCVPSLSSPVLSTLELVINNEAGDVDDNDEMMLPRLAVAC